MRRRSVGVREAKARLSRLLREAQQGREWVITDRGTPVARLTPVSAADLPLKARLRRLEDAGVIEPQDRPARPLPSPLPLRDGLAQRWLQEDRNA